MVHRTGKGGTAQARRALQGLPGFAAPRLLRFLRVGLGLGLVACGGPEGVEDSQASPRSVRILNASYDPTRGLYREFNAAFARRWEEETGQAVTIDQSHGGSGSQARAVVNGLDADVVTLALTHDVDQIASASGMVAADWRDRLPLGSAPYGSTIAFLVRSGNPKGIHTWEDLARPDVQVITANPKTSGVARWAYLAMWGSALRRELGPGFEAALRDPAQSVEVAAAQASARDFVAAVFRNVPVLDQAARGATNTFIQRRIGDVLVNWENEILLAGREIDAGNLEVVIPPMSILAEPVVAVVDATVDRRGTREVAEAYLAHLYSDEGQDLVARHYYRPLASPATLARYRDRFPDLELFTVAETFGGWSVANAVHFSERGTFDQIYGAR